MKAKDELFTLIKSMNKNEKGYFRKFSGIHSSKGTGDYLKLFDCISRMEVYDEASIKKEFKGQKILGHLRTTKHYLKGMIVKSLRNYFNDTDPDIERQNAITEIMILNKKQLYQSAMRAIKKQKKEAEEREAWLKLLQLQHMEYQTLFRLGLFGEVLKTADERLSREHKYLQLYGNLCDYRNLQGIVVGTLQTEGYKQNNVLGGMKEFLKLPLLLNGDMALSFNAKMLRYEALSRCYRKVNNGKQSLQTAIEMVELYKKNPRHIALNPYNYMAALKSLFSRYIFNGNNAGALDCITGIEEFLSNPSLRLGEGDRYYLLANLCEMKLSVYAKTARFDLGIEADKELQFLSKKMPLTDDMVITAGFFSACCYLGAGQVEEALKQVNKFINGSYENIRNDVMLGVYGLNILVHYELENYSIIKRQLKLMQNFISKHKFNALGWGNFAQQVNKIVSAKTTNNQEMLKKNLEILLKDLPKYAFINDPIINWWINSKLR